MSHDYTGRCLMSRLRQTLVYRLWGARGLRIYVGIWFSVMYLTVAASLFFCWFLPWSLCVLSIASALVAAALLTKMCVSFFREVRSLDFSAAKSDAPPADSPQ